MTESAFSAPFSIEDTAVVPAPGMRAPNTFTFSRDGRFLLYLLAAGEPPIQQLYALDTHTGQASLRIAPPGGGVREEQLSPEEELRRQRERNLAIGLTHYSRAAESDRLMLPIAGDIYVQDGPGAPLRQVVASAGQSPALAPALSPDGERIAFVRDAEVYVVAATGGEPRQITTGARGSGKTHGLAEYIAQEELDRPDGFWWSPDGQQIAYTEVDETQIPLYVIPHQGKATTGPEAREEHRYPFAGGPNARVTLAVVPSEGGAPVTMDLDVGYTYYVARVFWWRAGQLGAVLLNREQTSVELVRFDAATGTRSRVLAEQTDLWINLTRRLPLVLDDGGFVWPSERSGFRHLYLYDGDGCLVRQLTSGEWMVDELVGVDERGQRLYFTGNREDPREAHLYVVPLAGGEMRRITTAAGTHGVSLDPRYERFVDVFSSIETPPTATLRALADDAPLYTIETPEDPRVAAFALQPPELVTLSNRDGTTLYGAVYRPPECFGSGPYPVVVQVYGGPHAQRVTNSWGMTAAMTDQYLRALGFLVFRLDNRGSARRGLAFEGALRHHMGTVEVDDQVDGVRWLAEQGLADPGRVGITGWSYGGYMSLMCLFRAPDTFRVAVAGAPVTFWEGYDTAYTERYMGTPQSNSEGYAGSSALNHVAEMRGKLLLIHGGIDENVHFRHTARLVNALIAARKDYALLLFPDERHMPRHLAGRVYLNEHIVRFFQQYL